MDRLFIDESHYYKNLYLYTKMRNVGGIAQTEAQKSSDLFIDVYKRQVFYTDANGSLVTPEKLDYGKGYSIVEVQAPYGSVPVSYTHLDVYKRQTENDIYYLTLI